MKLKVLILSALLISYGSVTANDWKVNSLFNSDVFAPYVQIPFRISGPNLPVHKSSYGATILDDTENVCQLMQDPYIYTNFFLRCNKEATVKLRFEIQSHSLVRITYGPVQIKKLENLILVDNNNPALAEQISLGRALFTSNCIACHYAHNLRDRTAGQIKGYIQNEPQMKIPVLQGLSNSQLELIATYLRNLESP
jgi:hypothetical protein